MRPFSGVVIAVVFLMCGSACTGTRQDKTVSIDPGVAGRDQTPYRIPRIDRPVNIDGNAEEWAGQAFAIEAMVSVDGRYLPPEDLDARVRVAWNDDGLLMLFDVRDDVAIEEETLNRIWAADSVEVFVSPAKGHKAMTQYLFSPGFDPRTPEPRVWARDATIGVMKEIPVAAKFARTRTEHGYAMELLLPWKELSIEPRMGREFALQFYVNDRDQADPEFGKFQVTWFGANNTNTEHGSAYRVALAREASPAVVGAGVARYHHFSDVRVNAIAPVERAGEVAELFDGGRRLGRATLAARDGRAVATVCAPLPPEGKRYQNLTLRVGGRPMAYLKLDDLARERTIYQVTDMRLSARYVFSGEEFPRVEFENPLSAEAALGGPYGITTTFYDRDYNVVTRAERPGRYGGVTHVHCPDGRILVRYATFYRTPELHQSWDPSFHATVRLPRTLGIDPEDMEWGARNLSGVIRNSIYAHAERSADFAAVLAGLAERKSDSEQATVYDDAYAADRQWWVDFKRRHNGNAERYSQPISVPQAAETKAPTLHEGSAEEAGMSAEGIAKVDALLTEWAGDSDEPFVVCIARKGVVVLHKAYGTRSDGSAMTTDSLTYMASLTKLMHGTCMMMLVDQGLVDLDAPASTYLPELRATATNKPMTVRHLFYHLADMFGHWGDEVPDFEHRVAELQPHLKIGDRYAYNGMDLSVGSKIIEQISAEALPQFYQRHLIGPLGMKNTEVTNSSYNAQSVAYDMAVLGQMLLNGGAYGEWRFFSRETRDRMLPQPIQDLVEGETKIERGIGTEWFRTPLSPNTFGHGAASRATLRIDLDNELVVSMTRSAGGKNFDKYHTRFLRLVGESLIDPKNLPEKTPATTGPVAVN